MKKHIYRIIFAMFIILSGCTEDLNIDYKGKSTNSLSVYGTITTDTTAHKVILSRTIENGSDLVFETDATITISDSLNTYKLEEKTPGHYFTDSSVYGIPGHLYNLSIITKDDKEYTAQSMLHPVSDIDSFKVVKDFRYGFSFYKTIFFGQEPAELGQYYLWNLYINDSLFNDTINETFFQEDALVNGQYFENFEIYFIEDKILPNDTVKITLEMASLTEDYYDYLFEVMSETTWRGSPWDPVPANVSTNISNGGVGFFTANAKTHKTVYFMKE